MYVVYLTVISDRDEGREREVKTICRLKSGFESIRRRSALLRSSWGSAYSHGLAELLCKRLGFLGEVLSSIEYWRVIVLVLVVGFGAYLLLMGMLLIPDSLWYVKSALTLMFVFLWGLFGAWRSWCEDKRKQLS